MIPTKDECLRLMNQYGMLNNIVDHSIQVTRVALYLARELRKRGQRIDVSLVEAASLLHDLTKAESLRTREDHARTGAELLKRMGYKRVGEVVAEHIHLLKRSDVSFVSEEEIVHYADKRVRHDRIVSVEERFNDLLDRYGEGKETTEQIERLKKVTIDIEVRIVSILGIDPSDIQNFLFEEDRCQDSS